MNIKVCQLKFSYPSTDEWSTSFPYFPYMLAFLFYTKLSARPNSKKPSELRNMHQIACKLQFCLGGTVLIKIRTPTCAPFRCARGCWHSRSDWCRGRVGRGKLLRSGSVDHPWSSVFWLRLACFMLWRINMFVVSFGSLELGCMGWTL